MEAGSLSIAWQAAGTWATTDRSSQQSRPGEPLKGARPSATNARLEERMQRGEFLRDLLSRFYWRADDPFGGLAAVKARHTLAQVCEALSSEDDPGARAALLAALATLGSADHDLAMAPASRFASDGDPSIAEAAQLVVSRLHDDGPCGWTAGRVKGAGGLRCLTMGNGDHACTCFMRKQRSARLRIHLARCTCRDHI